MSAAAPGTVGAALVLARESGVARLDAQLIVAHVARQDRAWVIAHDAQSVDMHRVLALIDRRAAGEPLAYLVGEREFHGLSLRVTPDVLVPRPDTEMLVDWALELLAGPLAAHTAPQVVDLGTGSGAIALAVKSACPRAFVHAVEHSPAALAVAQDNALRLGLEVHWHLGNWWGGVCGQRFDLVLSNPPYVAPGDPHLSALAYEPASALVPQDDPGKGMADIERIVAGAQAHLVERGWMLLEHGADQALEVRDLMRRSKFRHPCTRRDLAGQPRTTGAQWRG
jgi:release factor glutamine methyltransferase